MATDLSTISLPELKRLRIQAGAALQSESYAGALANQVYSDKGVMLNKDTFRRVTEAVITDLDAEIAEREQN